MPRICLQRVTLPTALARVAALTQEHVVPANIAKPVKGLLTNLLTAPPPHRVTAGVRRAVCHFSE